MAETPHSKSACAEFTWIWADEMLPIASDARPQRDDIATIWLRRLWAGGNERRAAARLQHGERSLRDISTDGFENRVAVAHDLGKIHGIVIDDLIGADLAQVVMVRRAGGRDDACAEVLCQLDGKARDTARPALDQDRLTGLQF